MVAAAAFEAGRALVTENVPDFRRIMAAAEESGDPLPLLIYTTNRRFPCAQAATLGRLVLALDAVSSDPEEPMASFYLRPHED